MILKEDRYFAVSDRGGSMTAASPDGQGLWLGDTRVLSEYHVRVDGRDPQPVDLQVGPGEAGFELEAGPFRIRRDRYVADGLHERLTFSNATSESAAADVDLAFGADYAAMLSVRNILPPMPSHSVEEIATEHGLRLQESGGDRRATEVTLRPAGTHHRVELPPGATFSLQVDVATEPDLQASSFDSGVAHVRERYRQWRSDCAAFVTDNPALNELIEQSRDDMRMLCDFYPTGVYPTGGLPWFAVPFGRDALFTSMFALPLNPALARGAVRFLALHQGQVENQDTEEQPGKILHEVRTGDVVERGIWPHILFGTVDATPLYLVALAELLDWTGDDAIVAEVWPAAEKALGWCETYGDSDGDGWIDYHGARARNQGWKDSDDSLTQVDGSDPPRPAALCEVQGYYYRGLLAMARRRPELKLRAAEVRRRFNTAFWMRGERFVAQALDAKHRQVKAITSNPGHCLWSGILGTARARNVAERLVEPDMWSGWGVRTLSDLAVNYDPCSYHNGSVWPHDSALAAAGMRRSGRAREAEKVARGILEAGMHFPDRRLPELWCGTSREPGELPDDYRSSCSPQNWAAASVFSLLTTLLGLRPDAARGRLHIDPVPTALFSRIEVTGLHFAGRRVDFVVDGDSVQVGDLPAGVHIVRPKVRV